MIYQKLGKSPNVIFYKRRPGYTDYKRQMQILTFYCCMRMDMDAMGWIGILLQAT